MSPPRARSEGAAPVEVDDEESGVYDDPLASINRKLKRMKKDQKEAVEIDQKQHEALDKAVQASNARAERMEGKIDGAIQDVSELKAVVARAEAHAARTEEHVSSLVAFVRENQHAAIRVETERKIKALKVEEARELAEVATGQAEEIAQIETGKAETVAIIETKKEETVAIIEKKGFWRKLILSVVATGSTIAAYLYGSHNS